MFQRWSLLIAGDLNAQFGMPGILRATDTPNARDLLRSEALTQTDAYAASLSTITSRPNFTSGSHRTTIEYFIASDDCSTHISYKVHEEDPYLTHSLYLAASSQRMTHLNFSEQKINWKAVASNHLSNYQSAMDEAVRPLIGNAYTSVISEIAEVTHRLREAALQYLPKCKDRKHFSKRVKDPVLKERCKACRIAHLKWKQAGRPYSDPLLDKCIKTKRAVKERQDEERIPCLSTESLERDDCV